MAKIRRLLYEQLHSDNACSYEQAQHQVLIMLKKRFFGWKLLIIQIQQLASKHPEVGLHLDTLPYLKEEQLKKIWLLINDVANRARSQQ